MTQAKVTNRKKSPGVISTIFNLIEKSGTKGITKQEILDQLIKRFPDRSADKMNNTVNVQIPHRVSRERFKLEKLEGGLYRKAVK
mgnify:CR=1 FL=1